MASPACVLAVNNATGKNFTASEVEAIEKAVLKKRATLDAKTLKLSDPAAFNAAAKALVSETKLAAIIEKRSRAINVQAKLRRFAEYDKRPGKENIAVRDLINRVDANQKGIFASELAGPMIHDLEEAGVLNLLGRRVGELDLDIAREMWHAQEAGYTGTGNATAKTIAGIVAKYVERGRIMQNEAGAFIKQVTGYITRQSHDPIRIAKAGFEKWRDDILPALSEKTFEGITDRATYLKNIYDNLVSGLHLKSGDADWLGGFKGPASVAKRASQDRVLEFKGPDEWFKYNSDYGSGSMMKSIIQSLENAGRNTAIMREFGTNPRAAFDSDIQQLMKRVVKRNPSDKVLNKLKDWFLPAMMDQIDGTAAAKMNGSPRLAAVAGIARTIQTLKLGGAVLSSIPDILSNAHTLMHNGVPLLQSYGTALKSTLGRAKGDQRAVADLLGAGIEGKISAISNRFFSGDTLNGQAAKLQGIYFKANMLDWWTESHKQGLGLMLSKNLADNVATKFDRLDPRLQRTFAQYGIDAAKWDVLREAKVKAANGKSYLTPDGVRHISDDSIRTYLGDDKASPALITKTKNDLETSLSGYFTEQMREGMNEPGAYEQAGLTLSTRAGTPAAEAAKMFTQFKAFSYTFATRHLSKELYDAEGNFKKWGAAPGIAHLVAVSTVLGYAAITLKAWAQGKSAPDPTMIPTWGAAFTQGGGAGIYGDFLTGSYNRMGGGVLDTLAGPALGTPLEIFAKLTGMMDSTTSGDSKWKALKTLTLQQTAALNPLNLFYTKAAFDHFVTYYLHELANPGYLKRTEKRMKESGQHFIIAPNAHY